MGKTSPASGSAAPGYKKAFLGTRQCDEQIIVLRADLAQQRQRVAKTSPAYHYLVRQGTCLQQTLQVGLDIGVHNRIRHVLPERFQERQGEQQIPDLV
jgi:hypothetical protein